VEQASVILPSLSPARAVLDSAAWRLSHLWLQLCTWL